MSDGSIIIDTSLNIDSLTNQLSSLPGLISQAISKVQASLTIAPTVDTALLTNGFANLPSTVSGMIAPVNEAAKINPEVKTEKLVTSISTFQSTAGGLLGPIISETFQPLTDTLTTTLSDALAKAKETLQSLSDQLQPLISAIMPAFQQCLQFISDNFNTLVPVVLGAVAAIKVFQTGLAIQKAVDGVVKSIKAYKAAHEGATIAQWALNLAQQACPLVWIATIIAGVVVAIVALWNTNEGFRNAVINAWNAIKEAAVNVWNGIVTFFTETIPNLINNIGQWFSELPGKILQFLTDVITKMIEWRVKLITTCYEAISGFVSKAVEVIKELPSKIWEWLKNVVTKAAEWSIEMQNKAREAVTGFVSKAVEFIKELPGKIWEWLKNVVTKAAEWSIDMQNKAREAVTGFVSNAVEFIKELPGKIWEWLSNVINKVKEWASNLISTAKTEIPQFVSNVVDFFQELPDKIKQVGKDLVTGLWNGIQDMYDWVKKKVTGFIDTIKGWFTGKDGFDEHSPSKWAIVVGKYVTEGLAIGIKKGGKEVSQKYKDLMADLELQNELNAVKKEEYYAKIKYYRDKYLEESTEEWWNCTKKLIDYDQELAENQKQTIIDTYQAMVDEADKAISELEKKQENFEKKLQQNDYFFVTRTLKDAEGNEVDKFGELRDFSDEIEKINQYNDAIDKAQARLGDSAQGQAVYEALLDMDMEQGKLFADTLINASDAELQEYLKSYQEYQNAIKQASREEFADEWAELESQYGGMYQRLEQTIIDTFGEIPEEFLENGKLSAEQFGDGFLEKLTEVQSKLDSGAMGIKLADETALQQQRSDGQAAGEAFSQGLVQSEQAIQTAGSSLKDKLIEQFGSVPDDFFAIGQDSANSFCEGFMEKLQSAFAAIQNAVTAGMQSMAPSLALAGGFAAGGANYTYSPSYILITAVKLFLSSFAKRVPILSYRN